MHLNRHNATMGLRAGCAAGFTLMELMVVIGIIGMIVAVAMPQLLPLLSFSTHEGAARRLAGYGRTAMGHAALTHETVIVVVDLVNQEYWSEQNHFVETLLATQAPTFGDAPADEAEEMHQRFEDMAMQALIARANRVPRSEATDPFGSAQSSFNDRSGRAPLDLQPKRELEREEMGEQLLQRVRVPDGVYIESVVIGEEEFFDGVLEIELSPLGLEGTIEFVLVNDEAEYYTVVWDAITDSTRLHQGLLRVPGGTTYE